MLALFDGQTRYFLDVSDSPVKPDVLRFRGREALSEPFSWEIEFTTKQANIPPEQVLMKYATFRMRNGKTVHGVVTRLEWLSTSKDQSHYRLTLSSRLALLRYTRQCTVFQNQSVPEVLEQVLRKHGLEGADFEFRLERTYPARELITQWRETDLQFIQRILSEVGIYWRTETDDVRGLDTYIFADSQLNYQFDVRLPYSEPSGLFDGAAESVWDVRTWHNLATGAVTTRDYNYRTATTPMGAAVSVRNDAVTGAKATTRVRFFWRQDEQGNMRVYGVHTGEGTPYEGVRTANMVWNSEHNQYEFTPAHGADGPLITWTPERPEGSDLSSHTGSDIRPIDQATILVTPIPDGKDEYTTPPFPVPEERDLNDYILVFPADSGIKPIYVYLKTARDEPGVTTGKGEVLPGSEKWLEAASSGLGAPVPSQIADKLRGQEFSNFDAFRSAFWKAVAEDSTLLSQFTGGNQALIKKGYAPFSIPEEQVGGRKTFEIHHNEKIIDGGKVFDMDNLSVATPRRHIDIHRGKIE